MRYVFGGCTLDTEQYILYRPDGLTQLQSKVFQVLLYLLTHRDRVISKQELSEQVWPEQFISDATLEGVIKAVRRAVGDDGRTQWCIQTRRGHGYHFIAPVNIVGDMAAESEIAAGPSDATRRQLTIICCELVGATRLSQQFDPEEFHDLVRDYQAICKSVIQRFEGTIVQNYGTGLVAYFGYPQALEDAAYRAVRTGLDLVNEQSELNRRFRLENDIQLSIRVGIHTGLVVVEPQSEEAPHTPLATGAPPQVAVQIQRLAEPDTVLMSAATAALVQGLFISREIPAPPELDSELPTPLLQALRESQARNRFDVARSRGLSPLVGREEELGLLRQRWEQARQGRGQGVLLYGEAGIGKSRLVEALRDQVVPSADAWIELRCTSTTQHSAFFPVMTYLRQRLQWDAETSADTKLNTLEAELAAYGLPLNESVPLLAALLSVPLGGRYVPVPLPPDRQRRATFEALTTWLLRGTDRDPTLFVWEDIHWADASTLELITLILEQVPATPMLVLLTFRPPFQPPWPLRSYLTQLALDRLSRDQAAQMIAYEALRTPLPDDVIREVLNKSDGVPLFVEELMKFILETKTVYQENGQYVFSKPLKEWAIPTTLQDLLIARLDCLGSARDILQLGSILGREFTYNMLQAVTPLEAPELQQGLMQLVEAELLHQQGLPPQAVYLFKHALIQDAAYQSLLRRHRRDYHWRIAQVLETQFPEVVEDHPELLARHYAESERPSQAVAYWRKAGQAALSRLAYVEAIRHSLAGLEQLAALPTSSTLIEHELVLQCTLGMAYTATKGFAASEVEHAYGRALELCWQVEDVSQLLPILGALRTFYFVRGALRTARELAEKQLDLAQQQHHSTSLIQAYTNLGSVLFYLGELRDAQEKLQRGRQLLTALERYDVSEMRDSRVNCLTTDALALLLLGHADQALVCSREALTLAQDLSQPFTLAFTLGMTAFFYCLRRDYQAFQRYSEAALALAREQGFASFVATGEIGRRLARVAQGMGADDLWSLHQAIAARRAAGMDVLGTGFLLCLCEAYQRAGYAEAGLDLLAEIKMMMDAKEEYVFEAEWYRLKGECELQQSIPNVAQAEVDLYQAIEMARRRHAKWWELRAAVSLSMCWHQQGKREAARQLLGKIYGEFTEGFDTVDLLEAHACLERLVD